MSLCYVSILSPQQQFEATLQQKGVWLVNKKRANTEGGSIRVASGLEQPCVSWVWHGSAAAESEESAGKLLRDLGEVTTYSHSVGSEIA